MAFKRLARTVLAGGDMAVLIVMGRRRSCAFAAQTISRLWDATGSALKGPDNMLHSFESRRRESSLPAFYNNATPRRTFRAGDDDIVAHGGDGETSGQD
jgi:hypothetical protein